MEIVITYSEKQAAWAVHPADANVAEVLSAIDRVREAFENAVNKAKEADADIDAEALTIDELDAPQPSSN